MNISAPFIRRPIATSLLARGGAARRAWPAFTQLPVAPLPRVDFPTISVNAGAARRQPADDGVGGGDAARAPLRPHRRRHRDDLGQRARLDVDHAAVRPRSRRRRRPRATCRRRSTPPAASCPPTCRRGPNYRKVNPADSPILILVAASDDAAAARRCSTPRTASSRRRSRRSRASARCSSAAASSRPCACRSIRRRWPGAACRWRTCARALAASTVEPAQGRASAARRPATALAANDQLLRRRRLRPAGRLVPERRRRAARATWPACIDDVENNRARRLDATASAPS